jgi:hypothetical protein
MSQHFIFTSDCTTNKSTTLNESRVFIHIHCIQIKFIYCWSQLNYPNS